MLRIARRYVPGGGGNGADGANGVPYRLRPVPCRLRSALQSPCTTAPGQAVNTSLGAVSRLGPWQESAF